MGGGFGIMSPLPQFKYWGDVSPLSHRDRRPWKSHVSVLTAVDENVKQKSDAAFAWTKAQT